MAEVVPIRETETRLGPTCGTAVRTGPPPVAVLVFGMDARRIGGIEVHTREVVQNLAARGWRTVLCYHRLPHFDVQQYLSLPNVTLEAYPGAWTNSVQSSRGLIEILRRHRPRLLHLQFTPFLSFSPWIARLSGVETIVFTDHSSHPEGFRARRASAWKRTVGRILSFPVSHGITVSAHNRKIVETMGLFPSSKLRTIYNGVDLSRSNQSGGTLGKLFRQRHGIPLERIVVTQVSQMIPDKGVQDVLEAGRLALAKGEDLHFVFAGDGRYLDDFARMSTEIGLDGRVTWLGRVVDPFGEGLFAATDICCLASRWQEAFGLVIAEAMSCELPVVAARVGGIPEIVVDGKTGLLVNPRDPAALAECFHRLGRDPELRLRLGRAGRERAAGLFNVRTNVAVLMKLYGEPEEENE